MTTSNPSYGKWPPDGAAGAVQCIGAAVQGNAGGPAMKAGVITSGSHTGTGVYTFNLSTPIAVADLVVSATATYLQSGDASLRTCVYVLEAGEGAFVDLIVFVFAFDGSLADATQVSVAVFAAAT